MPCMSKKIDGALFVILCRFTTSFYAGLPQFSFLHAHIHTLNPKSIVLFMNLNICLDLIKYTLYVNSEGLRTIS